MLKHASLCRTNRAQQTLRAHWDEQLAGSTSGISPQQLQTDDSHDDLSSSSSSINNNNNNNNNNLLSPSLIDNIWFAKTTTSSDNLIGSSCSSSPVPSTPTARIPSLSSAPPSVFNSPSKSHSSLCASTTSTVPSSNNRSASTVSTIKIFAQTLSQEVEYVTLHVNAQTKSQQIIITLLKKFRLKHRDPNLFYLTLERWIRKDGLKFKSVMLLGDDACPLQLQQCCSSPPHNDIKFALQVRTGSLIKVFCSDVCPSTKYKCLCLSSQTTVDETIELMLHCLNLTHPSDSNRHATTSEPFSRTSSTSTTTTTTTTNNHVRQASSPSSTSVSNSSASSTSSSSGIESDLTNRTTCRNSTTQLISNDHHHPSRMLDSNSRSSSVTSISSSSNTSQTSSSLSSSEHYCLVIECENSNYKRILESNDHLVDVYQGLLDEAQDRVDQVMTISTVDAGTTDRSTSTCFIETSSNKQPDQWFVIKLKRREDMSQPDIKFTNPRQNMPLPPIPLSLAQFNNVDNIQQIVSTTQIEVNNHQQQRRPYSSNSGSIHTVGAATISRVNTIGNAATSSVSGSHNTSRSTVDTMVAFDTLDGHFPPQPMATASSRPITCHQKQISAIVSSVGHKMPPPPASLIWLPPIKPRRSRNLSNASSTFCRPPIGSSQSSLSGLSSSSSCNRRRYDPAQLAEDLNRLDMTIGKSIDEAELNLHSNKINDESSQGGLSTQSEKQVIEAATSGSHVDDTVS